ncbi:MAG TPA: hypothetical protein VH351_10270 [Bryobacteraceae bacterium]|jgi:hypothetical protein|nr:hypothetical protein [Bryobacteraceae bacterium]
MITLGTLLIQNGLTIPASVQLKDAPIMNRWIVVQKGADLLKLKEEISSAGWHYFYMSAIDQTVLGRDRTKCILDALKGLTGKMQLRNCNSIQIDAVLTHSLLGIPYSKVCAHCCHIQEGFLFAGTTGQ